MHRLRLIYRKHVVTRLLLVRGWLLYAGRRYARAEAVLQRGLTLTPASFRMHLLLGRVHLAAGKRKEALQEFSICYHLDPARFTQKTFDGALQEEVVIESQVPAEPDLFELCLREGGPLPGEWDDLLGCGQSALDAEMVAGTDFSSVAELSRFRDLPPLTREDVARTDIGLLLEQLSSISTPGETLDQG